MIFDQSVKGFIQVGDFATACDYLRQKARETSSPSLKRTYVAQLIYLLVRSGDYVQGEEQANLMADEFGFRRAPRWRVSAIATIFCLLYRIPNSFVQYYLAKLVRVLITPLKGASYDHCYSILFGIYWQDLRLALNWNLHCICEAKTKSEELVSAGFLGYTLTLIGRTAIGLPALERALREAKRLDDKGALGELYVFLGVAYQFAALPQKSIKSHHQFSADLPNAPAFAKVICSASTMNVAFTELGPLKAHFAMTEALKMVVSMTDSRNHIQIYGVRACLDAFAGSFNEAFTSMDRAEEIARKISNRLDWIICLRFSAVVNFFANRDEAARDSIARARVLLSQYGGVAWYAQEFDRIELLLELRSRPSIKNRITVATRFFFRSMLLFDLPKLLKGAKLSHQLLFEGANFWSRTQQTEYWEHLAKNLNESKRSIVAQLEGLYQMADRFWQTTVAMEDYTQISIEIYLQMLERNLGVGRVLIAQNRVGLLNLLRSENLSENWLMLNSDERSMRIPCTNDRVLVAISLSSLPKGRDSGWVAILTNEREDLPLAFLEFLMKTFLSNFFVQRAYAEARQSESEAKRRSSLADAVAQVAHDIRSPLSALSLVAANLSGVPEQQRILIREATKRINDIANNLLIMKKQEMAAIKRSTQLEVELLGPVVDSILSEMRMRFRGEKDVSFEIDLKHSYGLFSAIEPSEVLRVLANLINNSVESFKESRGQVTVSVYQADESANVIEIKDDGCGMSSEKLAKIRSSKYESEKRSTGSGFGLGLPHAFRTMKDLGGELEIDSIENAGTVIRLKFPKADPPRWFVRDLKLTSSVCILDDDTSIHETWKSRISDAGLDGKIAMTYFSSHREFERWFDQGNRAGLYLVDFELLGQTKNGLMIVDENNLAIQAVLVTSHFDDKKVRDRSERVGVRIIPKSMVPLVPISPDSRIVMNESSVLWHEQPHHAADRV